MTARVLIVDESLTVRMDIGEALEAAGFETVPCADLRRACRESTIASSRRRGNRRISMMISLLSKPGTTTRWPRIKPS